MMKIGIIPARGGSKRIERKNIRAFHGKPMIAYSIEAALQAGCFDQIVVSTDDSEIAMIAEQFGASVPFVRPAYLADDSTPSTAVLRHAIEQFVKNSGDIDYVCCIYATAPFLSPEDIIRGFQTLVEADADYALGVTSYPFPIQRAVRVTKDGRMDMFQPEYMLTRSQDLPAAYHDAGQFCWGRAKAFLAERPVFGEHTVPVLLPRYRVQDIDTEEDWARAELMYAARDMLINEVCA
ncbi:pseudaminic acid cytidylyltransferase [Cupriavidus sp. AcVe19-6a]|uniref:pseudaminic acid cytidylyltransferase n=1 Tax=Cupriavidus sp. AcVe19-6a TaxID=2821358 RepID=UPI001AE51EED|nr:pseudaminic acid cytidylyltransferase [Cupriavidus sp. AcVe19-6a]MBP0639832.1 pseudaminic acid cytidylyltransferase [Cupriavidus sp. AcVe19-6a]